MNTQKVTWTFTLEQAQIVLAGVAKLPIEVAGNLHRGMEQDFIKTIENANKEVAKQKRARPEAIQDK
jgi:hypothetical protein